MVHTAELTYFPDGELIHKFKTLPETVLYRQDGVWYNGRLVDSGLKFRFKLVETPNFISPRLLCRVNFSKLLHPNDKISLMTPWDTETIEERFNELTRGLLPSLPSFEFWKVNRIDYCVNARTPYVEEYLHLLKKGNRRHMKDWYDKSGNYAQKPGSLYYVATAKRRRNRGITVNFYNKADEMAKSFEGNRDWIGDEVLEDLPTDILRFEVQCHKVKIDSLQKKYGLPNRSVVNFLDPRIAYETISTYLKIIAGTGDYHRKSVALALIDQMSCRQVTKERMKCIIRDVAKQHSSIWKVRDEYARSGKMEKEQFNSLIRKMHSCNINPVTIRNNIHLEGKTLKEGLRSAVSLFESAIDEELTASI